LVKFSKRMNILMATPVQTRNVQLTNAAADVVRGLRQQQNLDESYGLRVYIAGQTCSGFQYGMALDNKPRETDAVFEMEGVSIIIDEASLPYMEGTVVDYIDDERGKGFLVNNPNTAPTCSCEGGTCSTTN
jgi:iron-sulfur cluster assembly accessory protein